MKILALNIFLLLLFLSLVGANAIYIVKAMEAPATEQIGCDARQLKVAEGKKWRLYVWIRYKDGTKWTSFLSDHSGKTDKEALGKAEEACSIWVSDQTFAKKVSW